MDWSHNCFLKHVVERKIEGSIETTGRRIRGHKQLPLGKERILEIKRESTRSHSVENSLWKRQWTCRKTYNRMNEWMNPIFRSDIILVIHPSYNKQKKVKSVCTRRRLSVPWLRRFIAIPSPRKNWFNPRAVYVGLVVNKVTQGQIFPRAHLFFSVNIIPTIFHARPLVTDAV